MGLRTGTGIGAEQVPKTFMGRQMEGLKAGGREAGYEIGVGLALRSAETVARAAIRHAERSELYAGLRQEQKLAIKKQRATDDFEVAISKNDDEIARIEKSIDDMQVGVGQAGTAKRAEIQKKTDDLLARLVGMCRGRRGQKRRSSGCPPSRLSEPQPPSLCLAQQPH